MLDRCEVMPPPVDGFEASAAACRRHDWLALPPSQSMLNTADLDQINAEMTRAISSHVVEPQAGVKRIAATKVEVAFGEQSLIQVGYGADVSIRAESCGPHFLIAIPLSGSALIRAGKNELVSDTSTAAIIRPGDPLHFAFSHDLTLLLLRVPAQRLEAHCAQLLGDRGHRLDRQLDFAAGFSLDNDTGRSWLRMMRFIRDEAANDNGSFLRQSPIAMASFQQTLMNMILTMQPHNYTDHLTGRMTAVAPFYIRRAEEFMGVHAAEPITLPRIAAAAGISVRALTRGFQDFRGTSPMAWLKGLRLERVREDLLSSDSARGSVSQIALAWGFDHLGHFGQDYRRRYGETPRETLQRFR